MPVDASGCRTASSAAAAGACPGGGARRPLPASRHSQGAPRVLASLARAPLGPLVACRAVGGAALVGSPASWVCRRGGTAPARQKCGRRPSPSCRAPAGRMAALPARCVCGGGDAGSAYGGGGWRRPLRSGTTRPSRRRGGSARRESASAPPRTPGAAPPLAPPAGCWPDRPAQKAVGVQRECVGALLPLRWQVGVRLRGQPSPVPHAAWKPSSGGGCAALTVATGVCAVHAFAVGKASWCSGFSATGWRDGTADVRSSQVWFGKRKFPLVSAAVLRHRAEGWDC